MCNSNQSTQKQVKSLGHSRSNLPRDFFKNKSYVSFQLSDGCKNNPDECGPGHCVPQACPDPAEYLAGRLEPSKQSYLGAEAKFVCNPGYVMAQQKVTNVDVECKAMPGGILVMRLSLAFLTKHWRLNENAS